MGGNTIPITVVIFLVRGLDDDTEFEVLVDDLLGIFLGDPAFFGKGGRRPEVLLTANQPGLAILSDEEIPFIGPDINLVPFLDTHCETLLRDGGEKHADLANTFYYRHFYDET